jgi:hypothetical protein
LEKHVSPGQALTYYHTCMFSIQCRWALGVYVTIIDSNSYDRRNRKSKTSPTYKIEVMNMNISHWQLHCGCSTTGLRYNRDLYPPFFADLKHGRVARYYPIMAGLSGQINHSKPVSRPVTNVINVN